VKPHADYRLRRLGALAGPAIRAETHRPRCQLLRHLRRLLLPRQKDHGDRRRRFGDGRPSSSPFRRRVAIVHRRDQFRASKIMLERARQNPKIQWIASAVVDRVLTWNRAWSRRRVARREDRQDLQRPVDGLFLPSPHPEHSGIPGPDRVGRRRLYLSKGGACTSVEGVFHAGDVEDRTYRRPSPPPPPVAAPPSKPSGS